MDEIKQTLVIDAPIARVWDAISDHRQFGQWFRVALDQPFAAGSTSTGKITYPGFEHVRWEAQVETIEPPHRLAFRWHPYAIDPERDYSHEPTTLVEFDLVSEGDGTRVTVRESGFDALPDSRRDEAYRKDSAGWAQQAENLRAFLANG